MIYFKFKDVLYPAHIERATCWLMAEMDSLLKELATHMNHSKGCPCVYMHRKTFAQIMTHPSTPDSMRYNYYQTNPYISTMHMVLGINFIVSDDEYLEHKEVFEVYEPQ